MHPMSKDILFFTKFHRLFVQKSKSKGLFERRHFDGCNGGHVTLAAELCTRRRVRSNCVIAAAVVVQHVAMTSLAEMSENMSRHVPFRDDGE